MTSGYGSRSLLGGGERVLPLNLKECMRWLGGIVILASFTLLENMKIWCNNKFILASLDFVLIYLKLWVLWVTLTYIFLSNFCFISTLNYSRCHNYKWYTSGTSKLFIYRWVKWLVFIWGGVIYSIF